MKERDSNIELLRLVCMFLIVFQHCIHMCAFPEVWDTSVMSAEVGVSAVLLGLAYIGVNCFVLISGYYSIKLKLRSILNIYLICAIYALIGYQLHLYIDGAHVGIGLLYHSIFCISHSKLWFVKCYVGLMLLSPLLNVAIQNMQQRTYLWLLVLLTILNVYFGFVWNDVLFNSDGYTIANFVYIYLIGGYISRYVDMEWMRKHRIGNASVYVLTSILWAGSIVLQRYVQTPWEEWGYNNPFTLIGAISFFILFLSIPKFYNKWVNWFATGTFAVYVVHCGDYFDSWFRQYVGQLAEWLHLGYGVCATIIGMLMVALILELVICCVDKIRCVVMQPILDRLCVWGEASHTYTHTHGADKVD